MTTILIAIIYFTNATLTAGVLFDALTVVAYSAHIVGSALNQRVMDGDEAEDEAASRTVAYFNTDPHVVRAACRALFLQRPCDLYTFAEECYRRRAVEVLALGREWLAHRRKPNDLVKPFLH